MVLLLIFVLPNPSSAALRSTDIDVSRLKELQVLDQRVADIGWKLAANGLELCPEHWAATGITLHGLSQYNHDWRGAATVAFGFEPGEFGVLAVAKDSPAWAAGLRPNDVIVGLNGAPLEQPAATAEFKGDYAQTDAAMARIESIPLNSPVKIDAKRGDKRFILSFLPVEACASRFELATSNGQNANSNGHVVQLFGRLVINLSKDDELALVMGHELAHNILGHNEQIKRRKLSTGLFAVFDGSGKVLRKYELEADGYGIFFAARAGFEYSGAAQFWRQFSASGSLGIEIAGTHPTPKARENNSQATIDEINRLRAEQKPLIPAGSAEQRSSDKGGSFSAKNSLTGCRPSAPTTQI